MARRLTQTPLHRMPQRGTPAYAKKAAPEFFPGAAVNIASDLLWPWWWRSSLRLFLSALRLSRALLGCSRRSTSWLPRGLTLGALPSFAGAVVAPGAPAGLAVAPGSGGRPPGLPLPRSNGEGDRPAGPGGAAVTPGRGRPPGVGFPLSNGEGGPPGGAAVEPGSTRPGLPRGPGETGGLAPPTAGLPPTAGDGLPPGRAAARVGGGIFLGFSVLIFCFSSA